MCKSLAHEFENSELKLSSGLAYYTVMCLATLKCLKWPAVGEAKLPKPPL